MQNVENWVILDIRIQRSCNITGNSTIRQSAYDFLPTFHSNCLPILHRFWYVATIADFSLSHLYLAPYGGGPISEVQSYLRNSKFVHR